MSRSFSELPDELLLEILSHLKIVRGFQSNSEEETARQAENEKRCKALHALSLTSRQLHGIVKPMLYQTLIQPSLRDRNTVTHFLQAIFARPSNAKYLTYLESLVDESDGSNSRGQLDGQTKEELAKLEDHVNEVLKQVRDSRRNAGPPSWQQMLEELPFQAQLALVISSTPNLKEVAIVNPHLIIANVCHGIAIPNPLRETTSNLERMWFRDVDQSLSDSGFIGMAWAAVKSPNLKLLWAQRALDSYRAFYCPERVSDLKIIELKWCELHSEILVGLIRACKSLQKFVCRWGMDTVDPAAIQLPDLYGALLTQKHSLETLVIDTLDSNWLVDMDISFPAIGSLHEFQVLKRLEMSGIALFGDEDDLAADENSDDGSPLLSDLPLASILPASLEALVIWTEWDDDIETALWNLAPVCPVHLPNLKFIDCSWRPATGETAPMLPYDFADIGVLLRLELEEQ